MKAQIKYIVPKFEDTWFMTKGMRYLIQFTKDNGKQLYFCDDTFSLCCIHVNTPMFNELYDLVGDNE